MKRVLETILIVFILSFVLLPVKAFAEEGMTLPSGWTVGSTDTYWNGEKIEPKGGMTQTNSTTVNSSSSGSGAVTANGEIFTILQKKLYDTLKDLRKIVYVISGFGLIVFAVAAIFNKISYKHLGYIMIGLSLLALMFPFLEYFSGVSVEEVEQKQLAFDNYLAASDYARIRGEMDSDVLNGTAQGQDALSEEELIKKREEAQKNAIGGIGSEDLGGSVTGGLAEGGLAGGLSGKNPNEKKLEQAKAITDAGCSLVTMKGDWNENGTRTVCAVNSDGNVYTTIEACQGKMKNGSCTKTFGQIVSDTWGTVTDAIQVGLSAGQAVGSTIGAVLDSGTTLNRMKDIIDNDNISFMDKMYYLGNLAANTWGSNGAVTRDLYGVVGGLQGVTTGMGNTATRWSTDFNDNVSGENPFTNMMNQLGGYGETVDDYISIGGSMVRKGSGVTSEIHNQANNVNAMVWRFQGSNGGTYAEQWNEVFHGEQGAATEPQPQGNAGNSSADVSQTGREMNNNQTQATGESIDKSDVSSDIAPKTLSEEREMMLEKRKVPIIRDEAISDVSEPVREETFLE